MNLSFIPVVFLTLSAASMAAIAQDRSDPPTPPTKSTASRAEVKSQAAQATAEKRKRGYNSETGEYARPAAKEKSKLTRQEVRAEARKAKPAVNSDSSN